ncbi:putative potassium channel domain-containing protein [Lupinus albus]|uniref:Putative potassium channel domain-containing protein n=1 Tax=Lupinus albus TaxID=3870 RepID=A0A6A4Q770_LUPAL|nr:putative potassium channel domain-containing protein [Lupinus albus]
MLLGIVAYFLSGRSKVSLTSKLVNDIYFVIVTLTSVGYGDIVPHTTIAKIMISLYILVGFWMWGILINHLMDDELEQLRTRLVKWCDNSPYKNFNNHKVMIYLTIGVIFCFIIIGAFRSYFLETMSVIDSFYLSVVSISTVDYEDYSFDGRVFEFI